MRGKKAKKRKLAIDAKYNSITVSKLINYVMLDGKKNAARRIVYAAIEDLGKKTKQKPIDALETALSNVKPKVEVKSRRVGGANYQVPVPVDEDRQLTLALRWIVGAIRSNRGSKETWEVLTNELLAATNKEGTAYKKREETYRMAEANKAFSHLGW